MDLKATLLLPNPDFTIPMKADLAIREPEIQAKWAAEDAYQALLREREGCPDWVLHDGPPYTNGPIHLGTAMNKILKDFAVRSHSMLGYRCPYVPGFDNHGLPIEQAVMAKLAKQGAKPSVPELRAACREHAAEFLQLQSEQFQRLGVWGDWGRPYTTMGFRFEGEILRVFRRLVEKGYVFRGLRPTLWSPTAQTALADTEIVYRDVESAAITVKFPLSHGEGLENPGGVETAPPPAELAGLENVSALIWTTTPWTIPANLALAFHPEAVYAVVKVADEHWVMADLLVSQVLEQARATGTVLVRVPGKAFERTAFRHPLFPRLSLGVLAEHVTTEDGTGVVHTAPGHGRDDFYVGQSYGLPVLCPVDSRGVLTEEAGEFAGTRYSDCDTVVVERLGEVGALVHRTTVNHSYPHAERDEKPVIFRATEQWFVSIDHEGLRDKMLDEINQKVEWHPSSGRGRLVGMIANRPDWCVSRQRPWGVGIPVFYGEPSGVPVLDPIAIEAVAEAVDREGSDVWFSKSAAELLPAGYRHPETGETAFRKETDVFDVWFDSGSTSFCVLEGAVEPAWRADVPADLYLEGSDQHRGWFNLSLVLSTALRGFAPYKKVATHGFVLDAHGRKMSKRLGNVVDPLETCQRYGADVLRAWVASVDYTDDAPCSDDLIKVAAESYRSIRNTLRFLLANLQDFEPGSAEVTPGLCAWAVEKTAAAIRTTTAAYRELDFKKALDTVHSLAVNELSRVFADAVKDTMYCDAADAPARRGAQAASYAIVADLVRVIAPILPHTAEEVYARIPMRERKASVHFEVFPETGTPADVSLVDKVLEVRAKVNAKMEAWRAESGTKDSQDIHLTLRAPAEDVAALHGYPDDLAILFRVAHIDIEVGEWEVGFKTSPWLKCERSRLRRADVAERVMGDEKVTLSERDFRVVTA
ncbi:MAG: isoleucine--tRNA ligase [Fimbriimonadaceae bacterium]